MPPRKKIALLFEVENPIGRRIGLLIQFLIIGSLVGYAASTLPHISDAARFWLTVFEVLTVSVFTVEYLLRLYSSERRLRFVFSFFGLVDLLAILPFYLGIGSSGLSLRIFRVFRLIRLLKLARYNDAVERLAQAFRETGRELVMFFLIALAFIYLAATGIYHFEHEAQPEAFQSIFHSIWWAVATLTTVGYGDVYPVTPGGKLFTSAIVLIGVAIVAVPSGLIAAALTREQQGKEDS